MPAIMASTIGLFWAADPWRPGSRWAPDRRASYAQNQLNLTLSLSPQMETLLTVFNPLTIRPWAWRASGRNRRRLGQLLVTIGVDQERLGVATNDFLRDHDLLNASHGRQVEHRV